jgi:hypothetical protein
VAVCAAVRNKLVAMCNFYAYARYMYQVILLRRGFPMGLGCCRISPTATWA